MSKVSLSAAFVTALLACAHAHAGMPDGEAVRAGLIANFDDIVANKRVTVTVPCDGKKCTYQSTTHTNYYINDHFMLPIKPEDVHAREVLMRLLTHAPISLREKGALGEGISVTLGRQFDIDLELAKRRGYPTPPPRPSGPRNLPPGW